MTIADQSAKGRVVVLDIEMEVRLGHIPVGGWAGQKRGGRGAKQQRQGVKQIKKSDISARYVFIAPPSEEILEERLRGRGTENEKSIQVGHTLGINIRGTIPLARDVPNSTPYHT